MIRREAARLVKFFDGIRAMDKLPGAMFVVDIKREHNAVAEARRLKIPVVAIVDTNCDPDLVDLPDRRQRRRDPLGAHDPGHRRPGHHPGPGRVRSQSTPAARRRKKPLRPPPRRRRAAAELPAAPAAAGGLRRACNTAAR